MTDTPDAAIRALLDRLTDAVRRKDATATVACFAPDVVSYDLAPPLAKTGGSAVDPDAWQGWFDTWDGPIESETRDMRIEVAGDLACAWTLRTMRGTKTTDAPDAGPVRFWFRATVVAKRHGAEWRIVHAHNSVPFAMDGSGKGLFDLEP